MERAIQYAPALTRATSGQSPARKVNNQELY